MKMMGKHSKPQERVEMEGGVGKRTQPFWLNFWLFLVLKIGQVIQIWYEQAKPNWDFTKTEKQCVKNINIHV